MVAAAIVGAGAREAEQVEHVVTVAARDADVRDAGGAILRGRAAPIVAIVAIPVAVMATMVEAMMVTMPAPVVMGIVGIG